MSDDILIKSILLKLKNSFEQKNKEQIKIDYEESKKLEIVRERQKEDLKKKKKVEELDEL